MGLFSRKDKGTKTTARPPLKPTKSDASLDSGNSSLRSPPISAFGAMSLDGKHMSAGSTGTGPNSPLTPFSQFNMPKIDLPRPPDPQLDPAGYLRSLGSVRERSKIVTEKAFKNQLNHFDVDMAKFPDVVSFVSNIIKVRPPHTKEDARVPRSISPRPDSNRPQD